MSIADRIRKADVAQRTEPAKPQPSKAKRAEAMEELIAESAEELFPDWANTTIDAAAEAWTKSVVDRYKNGLAYQAAYQRDLRTIKRLGLNMTVKQYRESLK